MSNWNCLYNSCKLATGAEIANVLEASDVVDDLADRVEQQQEQIQKLEELMKYQECVSDQLIQENLLLSEQLAGYREQSQYQSQEADSE